MNWLPGLPTWWLGPTNLAIISKTPTFRATIRPTWSQTSYRSWYIEEEFAEPPRIEIEVVVRIQRLVDAADPRVVLDKLPLESPSIGGETLRRSGPTLETTYSDDLDEIEHAIEVSYEGSYELDEATLADGSVLDDHFSAMGGWISSTLVRLGDIRLEFLPPLDPDEGRVE